MFILLENNNIGLLYETVCLKFIGLGLMCAGFRAERGGWAAEHEGRNEKNFVQMKTVHIPESTNVFLFKSIVVRTALLLPISLRHTTYEMSKVL